MSDEAGSSCPTGLDREGEEVGGSVALRPDEGVVIEVLA